MSPKRDPSLSLRLRHSTVYRIPQVRKMSFAHSVVMHYHCFTIVVAPFYLGLMFILSYYLLYVFSLYSIVLTTLHISIVIALVCVYLYMLLLI